LFNRGELLALIKDIAEKRGFGEGKERMMVGTVGYPNVGKSSVINVLCGKKLVGVANRPGKTKHFQTLNLSDDICLCDCPGLVFPSFANSKAEMMTCGVLHIDTIRDYAPPISLLMSRVPKEVIEKVYGIRMPPRNSP
jgi:large subunit GTPase 1